MPYGLPWSEEFVRQLADREFRNEFVADQVRTRIALMIRALRDQEDRKWSQADLGREAAKPQSVISRIENPDSGQLSLQTMLDIAAAFDLPLLVDIPEWDDWFRRVATVNKAALYRQSFDLKRLVEQVRSAKAGIANGDIKTVNVGDFARTKAEGAAKADATDDDAESCLLVVNS